MSLFSKQISLEGQLVNYLVRPGADSKTAVFLHGWRSSSEAWKEVMTKLDKDIAAYAPDLPGFGKSEMPARTFDVADYAAVVAEFIAKLGLTNVTLVGHSFGGRIAIKLAATDPKLVVKIALVDAAGIREKSATRETMGIFARIARPLFRLPGLSWLRPKIYQAIGAEDYVATPELKETFIKVVNEDLSPLFPKIACPTLVVWGEKDYETPLQHGILMTKRIPNAKLVTIHGAGHFSFVDAPDEFLKYFQEFIIS